MGFMFMDTAAGPVTVCGPQPDRRLELAGVVTIMAFILGERVCCTRTVLTDHIDDGIHFDKPGTVPPVVAG
jgi:hypothetical protein